MKEESTKKERVFGVFTPAHAFSLGTGENALDIETDEEKLSFMSGFDIYYTKQGLERAVVLRALLDEAIEKMQQDAKQGALPEAIQMQKPILKSNPFL